ncbi:conserved Plasmodium protein, unknown function [Plasmodium vinckei lentum]|uniref:E3 ubiquitin-protein ligase listerin n=1 Tax=Plasmodium vinckei lentum TaxID=138297 RepID=A0A6V7SK68_PLAVN|nr:conserved Plasmodium protein, unknown function [Plasmodium vinckei lentum]
MKKKKIVKLKDEYVPKGNYINKDALLTNIFLETSQNEITDVESQHSFMVTNCISKLQKKNLQTKLKALNDLVGHLNQCNEDELNNIFPSFLNVYKKLIYHPNYNVRESLNICLQLFIKRIKKKIKIHLQVFCPPLFISIFDYNKNVKHIAKEILSLIFPKKEFGNEELVEINRKNSEEKKKQKKNVNKIKMQEENKLYQNIKTLNVNITNLYNCLKYIKEDLEEAVTSNLNNTTNNEDYDSTVYLFNVLSFFPSLIYLLVKNIKNDIEFEQVVDEGNVSEVTKKMNNELKERIKNEFSYFHNIYQTFFKLLNSVYKNTKHNLKLRKIIYLSVYNIIYILKKNKINYFDLNDNESNINIYNYIWCLLSDKEEYILKNINHILLMYFYSENNKMINTNFLRSYLSLVKQNRVYQSDIFNFNIPLFIYIFQKTYIQQNFFFVFFIFYFLLLNKKKSSLIIYYDILSHLCDVFSPFSQKQAKVENVQSQNEDEQNVCKAANRELELVECCTVLRENIFLFPLEIILIQKQFENYGYCFKNMDIYDILENTYYCSDTKSLKKKEKNKNNDSKKKTKLIDLRKNIEKEIIKENEFIDIFTNFISSFENLYDILLIDVLDMLDFYISKLFENKNENISKDEILLDSTKEKTTNGEKGSYIYNDGINFILNLLLKLKNLIFESNNNNDSKQIDTQKFNYTQERFINTFKNVFDSIFNLIKLKYYEIIPNLENNFFILHFVCNHTNDKNEYFTSLINIFKFFENIICSENLENDIYFSLIRVCLNFIYLFYEENIGDPPQLASGLVKTLLETPSNKQSVEVKLKVCIELINFMKSKNKKIINIEERVLSIYTEYISIPLSENSLNNNNKKSNEDNLVQSFYTALYIDFSQNNILFGNNFYNNILYIYMNRMIKNKMFCEANFVEFFLKIFGQTKFGVLKYGVGTFGVIENEPDYEKLNDLYLYFLLNIYLKINQKDIETYCINLFSYFKKESIYSCLIMMKHIFKSFSTNCEYNNTLNFSNTDTSDSERFSSKTYDDSDLSDVHNFHFASTEYSDNSSYSRANSWNTNKKGFKTKQGSQTCFILGTVANGVVTCSANSSEHVENGENFQNFEDRKRQDMRICLEMHRGHVLSDVYIHRLLLLYKVYHNIKLLTMHDIKNITYLFYDEEMKNCLNNSEVPIVANSAKIENDVEDTKNLDIFFRFIYQNIEREEFVFFLTSLKEELEKDKINRCNKFELFFIIYYYYIKKKKGKKKYMKSVNIHDTSISDIIYIMKNVKNYKILNICKILLKRLNYEDEAEHIITQINKLFLETASNELVSFKANSLYQLKIKLFMFKECIVKYVKKYNYCIQQSEVRKQNEMDNIESYSDKISKIKKMVPEILHTYIDKNFSLTLCEKNEIGSLNLIYHLICISKYVHNYNLFNFPLVKDFIKNIKYLSQKNYDIYFCAIHLIVSKEEGEVDHSEMKNVKPKVICDSDDEVNKINENTFFETNKIMIKSCLNNYLSFLNGHYKKIWNKQIFFYKKKVKTIDSVLGNQLKEDGKKLKTAKTGRTESNSSKIKKIKQNEDISTNFTDTIYGQNKMGLHFLKFVIFLMTKKDKREIIEDANIMKNLIKLIYFILSIHQCKNSLIHKKLKSISIEVLKELMGKFSHYLNGTKKMNFLSLYLGIDNYKTIFNQHNKSLFILDEITQNNITSEMLRRIKRRIFDMYLSTYYLYILILNLDKYKKNTMLIYRILNIILLNSLFIKELQQIKKNNQKLFEILSAYLFIDGNYPNEFLHSFFNSNIGEYEELVINKIYNDKNSDSESESGDNISRASYNHEHAENSEHDEPLKKVENDDWKESIPLGTQVYFHKTESDFFSDNNCLSSTKVSKNEKTSDQIANHLKQKQNESSTSQCPTDPLNSNQTHGSFVNESEKREAEPTPNSQISQISQSGTAKKKKKANPLFLLKSGLTNPFLMIDLDKNILDLYQFLLKRNYLSILLFLVNICLSSEYFIYDSELYKNFLIYLEEHDVDIYNFLEKFEGIDDISYNSSDSDTKYDLDLLKKNEKKMYIFLLTINLLLQLIAVYPTKSIMTINENKLLEIKNINELYLSNLIINNQINELENISKNYNSTTYYYDKFHKTLTFKFKITEDDDTQNFEGVTAKLSLNFMPNYPFSVLIINDKIEALDKRAPIHNSIKSMYKYARIGNINEIFIKFDSLMNAYFQNKSQCNICFMILHDKKTCDKICSKCNTSYHSYCLHKWFLTSHNTKCPSCQIQFS